MAFSLIMVAGSAVDFSVAQGRYRAFLGPGLSQAEGFRLAWNTMREEAGRDPAGIFSAAGEDAPGEPRAEDRQEADSVRLRHRKKDPNSGLYRLRPPYLKAPLERPFKRAI